MKITLRKGQKEDLPQVLELIQELALYEKAPQEVTVTLKELVEDSQGAHPVFYFFVAQREERIIGTAIYYIKYSTWKGKCLFLEDLIVKEEFRGNKVGKQLFEEVIKAAKAMEAKRMEWQVLDWNKPAIHFYKKFNVNFDSSWVNCKFTEAQLDKL